MTRRSSMNSPAMTASQFETSTKKTRRLAGKSDHTMMVSDDVRMSDVVDHDLSLSSEIAIRSSSSSRLPLTGTSISNDTSKFSRQKWDAVSDAGSNVKADPNRFTKATSSAASSFHDDQSVSDSSVLAMPLSKSKNSTTHNSRSVSPSRASDESPITLSTKSTSLSNSIASRRARHYHRKREEHIREFGMLLSDYTPLESFDGMSIMEMEYRLRYLHERYHLLADEVDHATRQLSRRSNTVVTRSSNSMIASALLSASSSSSSSSTTVSMTSTVSNNQSRPPKRQQQQQQQPLLASL